MADNYIDNLIQASINQRRNGATNINELLKSEVVGGALQRRKDALKRLGNQEVSLLRSYNPEGDLLPPAGYYDKLNEIRKRRGFYRDLVAELQNQLSNPYYGSSAMIALKK